MEYSKYIDHTLLKAFANEVEIINLCEEAKKYNFKSVCVNPYYVKTASKLLKGSDVLVCTVIGFPLGQNTKEIKAKEVEQAMQDGAKEFDMVINVGALKNKDFDTVYEDILAVVKAAKNMTTKVIIETCYLTKEEIIKACELSVKAGATFVKTSTGFGTGGATVEDVALMAKTVGDKALVKASGGIRTKEDFLKMIEAGASRIGTSNGVKIMEELK